MRPYADIAALSGLLLEESWVLTIAAQPGRLTFVMDFVLVPDHPEYREPRRGEQFCYRRGELRFRRVGRVAWTNQGAPPVTDACREIDHGHIDSFEWDDMGGLLEGDWGRIDVWFDAVDAVLMPHSRP